ncbi:MAG: inorganic phosphate transporter [Saprospiraceae bacterium]|nr:inorganic phosphate transporter [Saprospiraceae bacterium]
MFGLDTTASVFLILCVVAVCFYEAINGFHDTANAVATVIYTKTLKPGFAVVWSGIWNFLGVWAGGIAVAMGMIKMLPLNDLMAHSLGENIALVMAILVTAIFWNLATWYMGIPNSSSHTMIGSLLGGGFAFWSLYGGAGVNWEKAKEIGLSLLFSPLFGFSMAILLMFILSTTIKNKAIFNEPDKKKKPPFWIRAVLVTTCTLVSFFHGSNDGQKGVGLMLVVLIAFLPMQFAFDGRIPLDNLRGSAQRIEKELSQNKPDSLLDVHTIALVTSARNVQLQVDSVQTHGDKAGALKLRKSMQGLNKSLQSAIDNQWIDVALVPTIKSEIKQLKKSYEFAPTWVMVLISLSLGVGTMIGWKRIVVTIGEKIGKSHLTYAQGASAEVIAAMTIGLSTWFGLPVSTTHVLSSGVAGTMVASGGLKNLRKKTINNIALAWLLTLPVTFVTAGLLFLLFRLLA